MMVDDPSRTCRLDALLCLLTTHSHALTGGTSSGRRHVSASLQLFVNTHSHLMFADGPLAMPQRHYIALLVRTAQSRDHR